VLREGIPSALQTGFWRRGRLGESQIAD